MAAAFAALVSLQNNLHLIYNHPSHSFSFEHKQMQPLWNNVRLLIGFMRSHGNAHGATKEAAQALEERIARAAERAGDVIESHIVDQIRGRKTSCFLLDVQKVTQDLDYMWRKAAKVFRAAAATTPSTPLTSHNTTTTTTTTTVGCDDVLLQLLDLLTGVPSSRRVIPIVGMGGIGKTTLATHALHHPLIVQRFDIRLYATISQQYSVENIVSQLLSGLRESIRIGESNSFRAVSDDEQEELYKSLCGRRYLIILDDMWSLEAWDDIKFSFPDTNNGSRIVMTTRNSFVANHLGVPRLVMPCLDEGSGWDLFCQKAFKAEQGRPPELEEIGKKIVEKCNGLPLAIVVVGGHLRNASTTLEYWESVAKHMKSILDSREEEWQCMDVLSLSYNYLPPHLKPCFLLLGAFAEDERIHTSQVAKLWIGEGFLEAFVNALPEVVARRYVRDLHDRNLILVDGVSSNGDVLHFKLHDLVREMCLKIAKKEKFLCVFDALPGAIYEERRVLINGKAGEVSCEMKTSNAPPIRCLMYERGWLSGEFKLLRTLNKVATLSMSPSIFQQVNLRFLKVDLINKRSRSLYLPSSISMLWDLQMLTITLPAKSKVIAPYEIWEMLRLRHLEVTSISLLDPLPVERSDGRGSDLALRHLHTLSDLENFRLSEEACKRIPNVGKLMLSYYSDDEAADSHYYCPHNLDSFDKLETLHLQLDHNPKWRDFVLRFGGFI